MVSAYNAQLIQATLATFKITMLGLLTLARAIEEPAHNSLETLRLAHRDYDRFKDGIYPEYLIRFCEKIALAEKAECANIRNLAARRKGVTDLNAYRSKKKR